MEPGQASKTAIWVCMARAIAHGRSPVARFSDPTALPLLPDDARAQVERARSGVPPATTRERIARKISEGRGAMMVARTVEIDDAIRAAPNPQLVILGAGLDGRAYRMTELRDTLVFEVDHPDTQRDKRERAARLLPMAPAVRYVAVDFTKDSLEAKLAAAGHEPEKPTTWVWEGVVMYLTRAEIEASLAVIRHRSPAGSRLIVAYMQPTEGTMSIIGALVKRAVRRAGEPFKSAFRPDEWRALLARHGFGVLRDRDVAEIGAELSIGPETRMIRHLRIATAIREA